MTSKLKLMTTPIQYTDEFKNQLVQLYLNGNVNVILFVNTISHRLYSINGLNSQLTGSFKEKDNRSEEEQELNQLRKGLSNWKWKMIF